MDISDIPPLGEPQRNMPAEYIPAPYLVASSFMSHDDLVHCYKDFYGSLKYVSTAPELVFERLISNVGIDWESKINQKGHAKETSTESHEDGKILLDSELTALRSTISAQGGVIEALKSELRELKYKAGQEVATSCSTIAVDPSNNTEEPTPKILRTEFTGDQELKSGVIGLPLIGTFNSNESYLSYTIPPYSHIDMYFYPTSGVPMQQPPPIGFTLIPLDHSIENSVSAWASSDQAGMKMLGRNRPYHFACSWLEIDSRQSEVLCGTVHTGEDCTPSTLNEKHISFGSSYNAPPRVVVWLNKFDLKPLQEWQLMAYPSGVTTTGFTLNMKYDWNTIGVSWVSYAADMAGISSGSIVASSAYHPKGQGRIKFRPGTFETPPRVIIAINQIRITVRSSPGTSGPGQIILSASTSDITATGMTWHLDGMPGKSQYQIGASYIALKD